MSGNLFDNELYKKHFRVTIFGSARIKPKDPEYHEVYNLAKLIAAEDIDIVTGGGPGLMQAASAGHHEGRKNTDSYTIGLNIVMPLEQKPNRHLDIKKEFDRFSERLDAFMILSDIVVVAPGGIGTLLEFLYTWQLVQVKHICNIPIILMGDMWASFVTWIQTHPVKRGLLSEKDVDRLVLANTHLDAFKIVKKFHEGYLRGENICLNFKKYKTEFNQGV
jgi:uncharacterized protein (TIGR00730 family)